MRHDCGSSWHDRTFIEEQQVFDDNDSDVSDRVMTMALSNQNPVGRLNELVKLIIMFNADMLQAAKNAVV